jgi:hypothetical protein
MKRLLLIFSVLFFFSCEDKNEIIEPIDEVIELIEASDPIIGKWYYRNYSISNEIHYFDNCTQKGYFEFLEEGVGSYVTYKINNSKCTLYDSMNVKWSFQDTAYSIQTFYGDGTSSGFPPRQVGVIYQYYGTISDSILSLPVGWNDIFNFKQK